MIRKKVVYVTRIFFIERVRNFRERKEEEEKVFF